jgi:hypothetical protein
VNGSDGREIVVGTAMGLLIGMLLSWGVVYGLNRYLGPDADPYETTRSERLRIRSPELTWGTEAEGEMTPKRQRRPGGI